MATLRIRLFGNIRISHAKWEVEVKITRAVQALLAYLLLYRHRIHPREVLAGLFWGDYSEERARSCLSTALWRLRQALEPGDTTKGTYLVTTPTNEVGFNEESDHWLDVAVFEERVGEVVKKPVKVMEPHHASQLENALKLHVGELLEGFHDDWALRERERLRTQYLKGLEHLMDYHGHHEAYESAIDRGKEILFLEPLREEIHRKVMRLYAAKGQRALAVQQYKTCCRILKKELDIPPMEETRMLHKKIALSGLEHTEHSVRHGIDCAMASRELTEHEAAIQRLHIGMQHFREAGKQLQRAIRALERIVRNS